MTEREFCYWLQGFMELSPNSSSLGSEQVKTIKEHLSLLFRPTINININPNFTNPPRKPFEVTV